MVHSEVLSGPYTAPRQALVPTAYFCYVYTTRRAPDALLTTYSLPLTTICYLVLLTTGEHPMPEGMRKCLICNAPTWIGTIWSFNPNPNPNPNPNLTT